MTLRLTSVRAGVGMAALGLALSACGGGGGTAPAPAPLPSPAPAPGIPAGRDAAIAAAIAAAKLSAATDPACSVDRLGDFYWEIGDAASSTPIAAQAQGAGSVTAATRFNIASASKWVFGAYVLEKKGIAAVKGTPAILDALRFTSGYTGLDEQACVGTLTFGACLAAGTHGVLAPNPAAVGKFAYDSAHDQKLAAIDLGLDNTTSRQFDLEMQSVMGLPSTINMGVIIPLPAGGLSTSATDYAVFLRRMMNRQLVIGAHLGEDSVCANPSTCPAEVAYSPIAALNEPWRYSYNHWVESQDGKGQVDAFSSPGKWGFYPWITPDRKFYGILSRHDTQPVAYGSSVTCGRQIRKAFLAAWNG